MAAIDQEQAVQRVVHTDELTARDRSAAILAEALGYSATTIERHAVDSPLDPRPG